ncbi:MAG: glycosyltransferase family 2 protein [Bacteroidales bacterium]
MNYLAWIVIIFTAIQLMIVLVNLFFKQRLPAPGKVNELVSVLIPARNEENRITALLDDLKRQEFGYIEVLVFDDLSTDRTADIVRQFASEDHRFRLISSSGLPDGWRGKNYACHSLADQARGKYYLFLDADVRISGNAIAGAIWLTEEEKLGLVSVFPKQIMITRGEQFTVPLMNFILLSLLPLILVKKSGFVSLSAANGQFMFFRSDVYRQYLPHSSLRNKSVEDIGIARYLKRKKVRIASLLGNDAISCRMYNNYAEAVEGFSKNVLMFFGNSMLAGLLFWLITSLGFIAVYFAFGVWTTGIYLAVFIIIRALISHMSQQPVARNLVYIIPQQLALGSIIFGSLRGKIRKGYQWKGRSIS